MSYQGYPLPEGGYSGAELQATKTSPMLEVFNALDKAIDRLGKHCEILDQRLQPVLMEVNPVGVPPSGAEMKRVPPMPLATELYLRCERIEQLTNRILSLHERIGI